MEPSFIALGDMTIDAFITLQEAEVHCDVSTEECTVTMRWGDKIPYRDVTVIPAVGNSANAAVAAARLGMPTGLVSFAGNDRHGEECIEKLADEGVDTSRVAKEPGKKTNYHYILSYNAERTILIRHEQFSYAMPDMPETLKWLYFSSVGEGGKDLHDTVTAYLEKNPEIRLAFQPGTFQIQMGHEPLRGLYEKTRLFVCNKQEARKILGTRTNDMKELLREMRDRGPEIVCITDGPDGAYAYDGGPMLFIPRYPDSEPPKERTGAGDAFSATLAVFLAKGMPLKDALFRAPINSMSVVQHIGAQKGLLSEEEIERYARAAPETYTITAL